jgi:dUTP pyrophosphatase
MVQIRVRRLAPHAVPPQYLHPGDAGADLRATEALELAPGERALVGTGLAIELPEGYAGFVHPRSGLAARDGISIVNAPGTIDSGYRGEIKINLINMDKKRTAHIRPGDRIAQLVIQSVERAEFVETAVLEDSVRGEAGHGSTGHT